MWLKAVVKLIRANKWFHENVEQGKDKLLLTFSRPK
jgi:hypothetical protein